MPSIYGTTGNDNPLRGTRGNDSIYGLEGNDRIISDNGDDYVEAGDGDDEVNGYPTTGNAYSFWASTGNKTIYGGNGNDFLLGGSGNNFISGDAGNDRIYGRDGNDKLYGGDGNDTIYGNAGEDTLDGGNGDDYLSKYNEKGFGTFLGGAGNDTVIGSLGNDIIDGGEGVDELKGYEGNDTYYVRDAYDYIYDSAGTDTAYVSASFVKIPSSIEKVIYTDGALALPYWIDALVGDGGSGLRYQTFVGTSKTLYFSFPSTLPTYDTSADNAKGFTQFTSNQISRTQVALDYVASVLDLKFVKTTITAAANTLSFASNTQINSGGYAQYPSESFIGSDVFLNNKDYYKTLADGTYGANLLMHELGHALGLKHPFDEPDTDGNKAAAPYLQGSEDSSTWTYMSYNDSSSDYYLRYSQLDIAALQYIYGPSKTARAGNDTYKVSESSSNFIWDGSGTDTLDASNLTQGATVYLNPGYWGYVGSTKSSIITSPGQITVNFGSIIENLTGSSYADKLFGTDGENTINGGAGNDAIEGLAGNDVIVGGSGDDQLNGGTGIDIAQFTGVQDNYTTSSAKGVFTVSDKRINSDGIDTLITMERIKYSDKYVAIDVYGNAGITAKVIGAVLGKDSVKNPITIGIGLSYADKGMSYSDLGELALSAIGARTNDAIVSTIWKNLVGLEASLETKAPYIKMLQDGLKPGDFVVMAADHLLNTTNIGFVGLAQTGIEFIPT